MVMCSGISLACSDSKESNALYQIGRLIGYIFLAILAKSFGSLFDLSFFGSILPFFVSFALGLSLIFLGLKNMNNKKFKLKLPRFFEHRFYKIWTKLLKKEKTKKTIFTIGFISILLPCGLIYSVVVPLVVIDSYWISILTVVLFWTGTLPVMALAPELIKKILNPLATKAPVLISIILIVAGISTIGSRLIKLDRSANTEMIICD
jgi:sulfite exporter TauE/SafE